MSTTISEEENHMISSSPQMTIEHLNFEANFLSSQQEELLESEQQEVNLMTSPSQQEEGQQQQTEEESQEQDGEGLQSDLMGAGLLQTSQPIGETSLFIDNENSQREEEQHRLQGGNLSSITKTYGTDSLSFIPNVNNSLNSSQLPELYPHHTSSSSFYDYQQHTWPEVAFPEVTTTRRTTTLMTSRIKAMAAFGSQTTGTALQPNVTSINSSFASQDPLLQSHQQNIFSNQVMLEMTQRNIDDNDTLQVEGNIHGSEAIATATSSMTDALSLHRQQHIHQQPMQQVSRTLRSRKTKTSSSSLEGRHITSMPRQVHPGGLLTAKGDPASIPSEMKDFRDTVMEVQKIVKTRSYRQFSDSLEDYFKKVWKISRAQVYRYIDCAFVLEALSDYRVQPNRERLCRSMKKLARTQGNLRMLWEAVLMKVDQDYNLITSTLIESTWKELMNQGMVLDRDSPEIIASETPVITTSSGRVSRRRTVTINSQSSLYGNSQIGIGSSSATTNASSRGFISLTPSTSSSYPIENVIVSSPSVSAKKRRSTRKETIMRSFQEGKTQEKQVKKRKSVSTTSSTKRKSSSKVTHSEATTPKKTSRFKTTVVPTGAGGMDNEFAEWSKTYYGEIRQSSNIGSGDGGGLFAANTPERQQLAQEYFGAYRQYGGFLSTPSGGVTSEGVTPTSQQRIARFLNYDLMQYQQQQQQQQQSEHQFLSTASQRESSLLDANQRIPSPKILRASYPTSSTYGTTNPIDQDKLDNRVFLGKESSAFHNDLNNTFLSEQRTRTSSTDWNLLHMGSGPSISTPATIHSTTSGGDGRYSSGGMLSSSFNQHQNVQNEMPFGYNFKEKPSWSMGEMAAYFPLSNTPHQIPNFSLCPQGMTGFISPSSRSSQFNDNAPISSPSSRLDIKITESEQQQQSEAQSKAVAQENSRQEGQVEDIGNEGISNDETAMTANALLHLHQMTSSPERTDEQLATSPIIQDVSDSPSQRMKPIAVEENLQEESPTVILIEENN